MQSVRTLFQNNHFQEGDILYIQRMDRKTVICLRDGRQIRTYEPVKNVMTELSPEYFENINKGVVINRTCVKREVEGMIFMCDDMGFTRRKKPLPSARLSQPRAAVEVAQCMQIMEQMPIRIKMIHGNKREVVASREEQGLKNVASFESSPGIWLQVDMLADDSSPLESPQARQFKNGRKKVEDS